MGHVKRFLLILTAAMLLTAAYYRANPQNMMADAAKVCE